MRIKLITIVERNEDLIETKSVRLEILCKECELEKIREVIGNGYRLDLGDDTYKYRLIIDNETKNFKKYIRGLKELQNQEWEAKDMYYSVLE